MNKKIRVWYTKRKRKIYALKVSKSQKKNSWNSIALKTNEMLDKILPYEAKWSLGRTLSNISFVFWAMEFQQKMFLRFTDL